uniref:Survival protein SurE-like phosphatase/nucleotidase domain-containing protein n=1 Tax=Chenopodium quinoa TaxID=63459 RepID=A0A803M5C7_CHEQI
MTTSVKNNFMPPNFISNLNQALLRRKDVEQDESSKPTSSSSKSENVNLDVEDEDCTKPRILVTNGDGIESPGLTYLVEALAKEGLYNVFVNLKLLCDGRDKSTSGHGVTFGETIAISSVEMNGATAFEGFKVTKQSLWRPTLCWQATSVKRHPFMSNQPCLGFQLAQLGRDASAAGAARHLIGQKKNVKIELVGLAWKSKANHVVNKHFRLEVRNFLQDRLIRINKYNIK